jgi:hypothetical protein
MGSDPKRSPFPETDGPRPVGRPWAAKRGAKSAKGGRKHATRGSCAPWRAWIWNRPMELPLRLRAIDSSMRQRCRLMAGLFCWAVCVLPSGAHGTVSDLPASPGWTAGRSTVNGLDQAVDGFSSRQSISANLGAGPTTYHRLPEAAPWWSAPIACFVVSAVEIARWRRRRKAGHG